MQTLIKPAYGHWGALTDKQFRDTMLDFGEYCKSSLIINKEGKAVPFVLNEAQTAYAELIIKECFAEIPSPVIVVVHKSRQIGLSVVTAKLEQYIATRRLNMKLLHMMPSDELAKKFADTRMVTLLEGNHPSLLPEVHYTKTPSVTLKFRKWNAVPNLNSTIYCVGANSRAAGRGQNFNVIVLDEYAHYDNAKATESGILATRAKSGLSLLVYNSTANGVGNRFYDLCKQAQEPNSNMKYVFLPWHMLKEYEMEPEGRYKDLTELTTYDLRLLDEFEKRKYPVSSWARKLQFYHWVYENEAKRDEPTMHQEYPSFPDESFTATGAPVLPLEILINWRKEAEEVTPTYIEPFPMPEELQTHPSEAEWQVVQHSTIKRFKEPQPGRMYYIGVDLAMGTANGDSSAGVVLDADSLEEVCTFENKMEQWDIADICLALSVYYNDAIIVPERNMGSSFIDFIKSKEDGAARLYVDRSVIYNPKNPTYGVQTTEKTKREAIARARYLMSKGYYKSQDIDFIDDAMHFVYVRDKNGFSKAKAVGYDEFNQEYHDDSVMCRLVLFNIFDMRLWGDYLEYRTTDATKYGR